MTSGGTQEKKPATLPKNHPELFFATVRAIGTDVRPVAAEMTALLKAAQYRAATIQLSEQFRHINFLASTLKDTPENERYKTYMNAGDLLRSATQRADAAVVLGMSEIRRQRQEFLANVTSRQRGRAYVLQSLMHPREVETLQRVYGTQLFVVSVFAPRDSRVRRLSKKIAESWGESEEKWLPAAEEFVNRDFGITTKEDDVARTVSPKFAIDVQKTFQKADLFVSATAPEESSEAVRRFIELIFGHPFHTPTREEFGMSFAYNASLRSSSLGRGVGAAILTPEGDMVATGTNEAPRFGGGQYWAGDRPDGRTFHLGHDPSDRIRRQILADLIRRLSVDRIWAKDHRNTRDIEALDRVLDNLDLDSTIASILSSDTISNARVLDVIEYGREVHAEMAAITDAAKRGVPIRGCVLYCTTFPCHECARLIVSSGIRRVVYIEPYPKSRVAELYEDSIGLADRRTELGNRVRFEPFVGISPRRYSDLFSWVPRKAADVPGSIQDYSGDVVNWSVGNAMLRDTIADIESLRSGARSESIDCLESHNIEAFKRRLEETEAAYLQEEEAPRSS